MHHRHHCGCRGEVRHARERAPGGIWGTMLLGIAGSIVANYLGKMLGFYQSGEAAGFLMSVIGAGLLMVIFKAVSK